ncbi:tripartite tricarboxylate transporter substrate binding protein [Acidovorax sp. GBBC 3334]|uniref:Bug family tripartite tricarboxylate transporter substrate binding protein n=1 Tax=Acidovorax sp. GBBC 3334 TaxID=2940496 RepID=UPI0023032FE0|nr:tripartite tricarboxylate transporter substrate binding protein [Acidovorax sp. GBBC 3334]MDA8456921.1 tripartite tricarboxylate transporter substrate binding protein [Acidovorax sp. GBBC 3334]
MHSNRRTFIHHCAGGALGAAAPWALASPAPYPDKTVRIIIPYPAGGATDNLGRLAGQALQQALGQSFIADNKGGAGTTLGTRELARSAPDGYTLGMIDSTFTINPGLLGSRLGYDTLKDFTPICQIASAQFVLVTHPSVAVKDLPGFIAKAKAEPNTLAYGSAGVGSGPHLAGELLAQRAGLQVTHIPYRGGGTVISDLLGGQVQFAFATVPTLAEHIRAGKLHALAVTGNLRAPQLSEVPTFAEAGLPGVDIQPLFGLIGPKDIPAAVVEKISKVLTKSIQDGEMRTRLTAMGFTPVGSTPQAFAQRIREDVAKWAEVIRRGKIQPE